MARTDERLRKHGIVAVSVSLLLVSALLASACSSSTKTARAASATPSAVAPVTNQSAYRYAPAAGLLWYLLPPRADQPRCRPGCRPRLVRPAFQARAIAGVDTVAAGGHRWRLIVSLRKPAAAQLARVTRRHKRGSQIVIAVGRRLLVHAPLTLPILGGVWQISGLRFRVATELANSLRRVVAGYPAPHRQRHHHRSHHRRGHHHRRHHHGHRRAGPSH